MSVLLMNQAILIPSMTNILFCFVQFHPTTVLGNDISKLLVNKPMVNDHTINIPSEDDVISDLSFPKRSRELLAIS